MLIGVGYEAFNLNFIIESCFNYYIFITLSKTEIHKFKVIIVCRYVFWLGIYCTMVIMLTLQSSENVEEALDGILVAPLLDDNAGSFL